MSKDMLGVAVRKLVTLPAETLGVVCDLLEKMADPDWVIASKRFLRKENPWPDANVASQSNIADPALLEPVRSTHLLTIYTDFVAFDFFKKTNQPDGIRFFLGKNFQNQFLRGFGKVERNIPDTKLYVYKLRETSLDGSILAALGGPDVAKTSLAHMALLLIAQPKGEDGILLTNGRANIFYVEGADGALWTVRCDWHSDYRRWDVNAYPVTNPNRWPADRQVFSPAVLAA